MKLFFSLILTLNLNAREVILITYDKAYDRALIIEKMIAKRAEIPSDLITLKRTDNPCSSQAETIIHICIDNQNEMRTININKDVVVETLAVFRDKKL